MGSKFVSYVYWLLILFFILFPLQSSSQSVPALYVFGDSTVDNGNCNYLPNEKLKANRSPFGIDFNGKDKVNQTGRFTNGKTITDFLAMKLGLPLVPPYLSLSEDQKKHATTGVNYAAGGAGIFPSTTFKGAVLNLDMQIDYFTKTVAEELPSAFKNQQEQNSYLSKSIFLVSIGTNDYGNNYLTGDYYWATELSKMPKEEFTNLILTELSSRLKRLIQLGAKKFLINNLGPLGCHPYMMMYDGVRMVCDEKKNEIVKLYDDGMPMMLSNLQSNSKGTIFSLSDNWKLFHEMETNGDIDTTQPCVESEICEDRDKFFFFDGVHTSEVVNSKLIEGCFDKTLCTPNIVQLINHDAST